MGFKPLNGKSFTSGRTLSPTEGDSPAAVETTVGDGPEDDQQTHNDQHLTQEQINERELHNMFDVITGGQAAVAPEHPKHRLLHHAAFSGASDPRGNLEVQPGNDGAEPLNKLKALARDYEDADLYFKDTGHQNNRFFNGGGKRPLGASAKGVHFPSGLMAGAASTGNNLKLNASSSSFVGNRRQSQNALDSSAAVESATVDMSERLAPNHHTKAAIVGAAIDAKAGINMRGSSFALEVARASATGTSKAIQFQPGVTVLPNAHQTKPNHNAIYKNAAYAQTEASRTRLDFYANQLREAEVLPLDKMLKNRRPISAPHGTRSKSLRGVGVDAGEHGVAEGGKRSSGFQKKAPLMSGTICFGDYCFLSEFMPVQANGTVLLASESSRMSFDEAANPQSPGSPNANTARGSTEVDAEVDRSELNGDGRANASSPVGSTVHMKSQFSHEGTHRTDGGAPPVKQNKYQSSEVHAGISQFDLRPQIMKFQLPFRSVLTLRSEEDYLQAKVYEDWKKDEELQLMPRTDPSHSRSFRLDGHEKNLLDLTLRHLRRVAYCCLSDVRRMVVAMPAPHEPGSGFDSQWKALSRSYRKQIYVDALSKTHPSRFYQTVPVCDTCQFIYSMADRHRDEYVFGGQEHVAATPIGKNNKPRARPSTTGIEEARIKGRSRRLAAESSGQERQSPDRSPVYNNYADPRDPRIRRSSSGVRNEKAPNSALHDRGTNDSGAGLTHDNFDDLFDQTYVDCSPAPEAEFQRYITQGIYEGDETCDDDDVDPYGRGEGMYELTADGQMIISDPTLESASKLARRLKTETAGAREAEHATVQVGISTAGGTVSSWVRMLTTQKPESDRTTEICATDNINQEPSRKLKSLSSDNNNGKQANPLTVTVDVGRSASANPMGPLAGQGIGGPKGQYRGYSAPTGYMLGQAAGDVGSTYIDSKGNFLHPKKRSPAERGTSSDFSSSSLQSAFSTSKNAGAEKRHSEAASKYEAGDGIAFGIKNKRSVEEGPTNQGTSAGNQIERSKIRPSTAGATASTLPGKISRSTEDASSDSHWKTKSSRDVSSSAKNVQITSENYSHSNVMNIESYSFNTLARKGTISAMDVALAHAGASTTNLQSELLPIDAVRFDHSAPYFPLDDIPRTGTSRSGDSKLALNNQYVQRSGARADFAQYVPKQLQYLASGHSDPFEQMIKRSLEELEAEHGQAHKKKSMVRPKSASALGLGVSVGTQDRLRRKQQLEKTKQEQEDEKNRQIGYLGGLKLTQQVKDISHVYQS